MRSGHGAEVLLALVGTRSLGRLALSFCTLIISQTLRFVKSFFNFFLEGRWWELNPHSPKVNVSEVANLLYLSFLAEVVRSTSSPSVPLLYHTLRGLSRGFYIFFQKHLRPCYTRNGKHSSLATLSP